MKVEEKGEGRMAWAGDKTRRAEQWPGNTTAGFCHLGQLFIYACLGTEAVFPWGLVIHWISTKIVLCRLLKASIESHICRYIFKISILILENFRIIRKLLLFIIYKINYSKFTGVNVFTEVLLTCWHTRIRCPDVGHKNMVFLWSSGLQHAEVCADCTRGVPILATEYYTW